MTTAVDAPTTTVLDAERCDRCGYRAYVLVQFTFGALAFCAHDYHRHEAAINATQDAVILDNRAALNAYR